MAINNMDFRPVGIKYWGGWGDGSGTAMNSAGSAASLDGIMKTLKKYSPRDKKYLREKWRKNYLFYVNNLFDDEDQALVLNDNYLKSIDRELGLR